MMGLDYGLGKLKLNVCSHLPCRGHLPGPMYDKDSKIRSLSLKDFPQGQTGQADMTNCLPTSLPSLLIVATPERLVGHMAAQNKDCIRASFAIKYSHMSKER